MAKTKKARAPRPYLLNLTEGEVAFIERCCQRILGDSNSSNLWAVKPMVEALQAKLDRARAR